MPELIKRIVTHTAMALGADAELTDYTVANVKVENEAASSERARAALVKVLGEVAVGHYRGTLSGEDFSAYLQHVPGMLAAAGCRNPADGATAPSTPASTRWMRACSPRAACSPPSTPSIFLLKTRERCEGGGRTPSLFTPTPARKASATPELEAHARRLEREGLSYEIADLYADGFNPALSREELAVYNQGGVLDPLVKRYQQQVPSARRLILICPIWWNDIPPARRAADVSDKVMLIGFLDHQRERQSDRKAGQYRARRRLHTSASPTSHTRRTGQRYRGCTDRWHTVAAGYRRAHPTRQARID